MRRAAATAIVVLLAGCGGGGDDLAGELTGAVAVVSAPSGSVTFVGRDVAGTAVAQEAEARLEVLEVVPGAADVRTPYGPVPGLTEPIRVVRDPLGRSGIDAVLPQGDRVLMVVFTLLDPTRGGVEFGARLVMMDGGSVVAADWSEAATERLAALLDGTADPGSVLAETVEALADAALGADLTPRQRALVDTVEG